MSMEMIGYFGLFALQRPKVSNVECQSLADVPDRSLLPCSISWP